MTDFLAGVHALAVTYAYALIPFFAFAVDSLCGEPKNARHPVVFIGRLISFFENKFRRDGDTGTKKVLYGGLTVCCVLAATTAIAFGIVMIGNTISVHLGYALEVLLVYVAITPRSLAEAGNEIMRLLQLRDIAEARVKTGYIVGRDTNNLGESELTRATVETIAENTVDGIVAPLFWFAVAGPVGAIVYRAANTMDSMLGYKNERYLYFGCVAARLDDLLNYIPARLTVLFFIVAAKCIGHDAAAAVRIAKRDAKKHPSPNGGYAEAPVAGALHIRLGGYNRYGDEMHFREYMGDAISPLRGIHIARAIGLMYVVTLQAVFWSGVCGMWIRTI